MELKSRAKAVPAPYPPASAVAVLAAMLLIGGCAFTTGHVNLEYQPQTPATRVAEAASPPVAVQVTDKRPTQIVGEKINGFGMKTAGIKSDSDVPGTLKGAFETELKHRGFTIGANGNQVVVMLDSLQNSFAAGVFRGDASANAGMDVSVKRLGGVVVYDKYFTGQSKIRDVGFNWGVFVEMGSSRDAQTALNAAIRDAVTKVFADEAFIHALRKP